MSRIKDLLLLLPSLSCFGSLLYNAHAKNHDMSGRITATKLPRKYYSLVFGVIMGLIMSVLTSLAVTIVNIGVTLDFFQKWFDIFLTTFAIGFPITIAITPFVRKVSDRLTIS
jgi:hypothetical protein